MFPLKDNLAACIGAGERVDTQRRKQSLFI